MKKRSANLPVIAVAAVAVCLVAVATTLVLKARVSMPPVSDAELTESIGNNYYYPTEEETENNIWSTWAEITTQVLTDTYAPTEESTTRPVITTKPQPTTKPQTTKPEKTEPQTEELTVPALDPDITQVADGNSSVAVTPSGDLPKDMSFAGLSGLGYNVIGKKSYIYNNDKDPDSFQKNFGYNPLYDAGANLIDFSIDTVRLQFRYGDKDWMIQVWKGQYISGSIGTVGGEIGVYNRPKGTISVIDHYNCAKEEDWLNMEMTVFWDENGTGEYLPQLTRNYTKYWWATGFVDGQLANRNDSSPLRVLGRITFKDEEMAEAFEGALVKKKFTNVSTFSPEVIDTYKRHGKDVIFIWQDVR